MAEQVTDSKATTDPAATPGASPAPENGKGAHAPEPKGEKDEPQSVPLGTFKDVERKYHASEKELAKFRAAEKEAADKAAQAAGDVAKVQQERDSYKSRAEKADTHATARLKSLRDGMDDEGKAVLDALPESVDVWDRLNVAEKLSNRKQPAPGLGTKGGGPPDAEAGLIPQEVQTPGQYQELIAKWSSTRATPAERAIFRDEAKMAQLRKEARARGLS